MNSEVHKVQCITFISSLLVLSILITNYVVPNSIPQAFANISDIKTENFDIVNMLFTDRSRNIESDCSDGIDNDNDGLVDKDDIDDCSN